MMEGSPAGEDSLGQADEPSESTSSTVGSISLLKFSTTPEVHLNSNAKHPPEESPGASLNLRAK
jgi:hypothetical protein